MGFEQATLPIMKVSCLPIERRFTSASGAALMKRFAHILFILLLPLDTGGKKSLF